VCLMMEWLKLVSASRLQEQLQQVNTGSINHGNG
jgi:hypothetical protein